MDQSATRTTDATRADRWPVRDGGAMSMTTRPAPRDCQARQGRPAPTRRACCQTGKSKYARRCRFRGGCAPSLSASSLSSGIMGTGPESCGLFMGNPNAVLWRAKGATCDVCTSRLARWHEADLKSQSRLAHDMKRNFVAITQSENNHFILFVWDWHGRRWGLRGCGRSTLKGAGEDKRKP
nr:hypothetical protein [Pandoravirus massiliensis]